MRTRPTQPKRNQTLIAGAAVLMFFVFALCLQRGVRDAHALAQRFVVVPVAQADTPVTTCGTYTDPDGGLSHGGVLGPPFIEQGQPDPDCSTPQTGLNVCDNRTYGVDPATANCLCQQTSGANCGNVPSAPPQAFGSQNPDQTWDVDFLWYTNLLQDDQCVYVVPLTQGVDPNVAWESVYGAGTRTTVCTRPLPGTGSQTHTNHVPSLAGNVDYYFGVQSYLSTNATQIARAEIRVGHTYTNNFTINVVPPASTKVVTGETTDDWYVVTVHKTGTPTGQVTFSAANWSPSVNGVNVQWENGVNQMTLTGTADQTLRFKLQTSNGSPPIWPPTTIAGVYGFDIVGTHATLGAKTANVPNGLTVMDYHMTTSATVFNLPATGGSANFAVNVDWLPPQPPYNRDVDLSASTIPGLTTTFSNYSVPLNYGDSSFTVNLTTNGATVGSNYQLKITGRGKQANGSPGGLWREVTVTVNIQSSPDFSLSVATPSLTATQGDLVNNTLTVQSLNGFIEPVALSGTVIEQGQTQPNSTITLSFNPTQPQPPANGTATSTIRLTTTAATPCAAAPGERYSVTIEGRDNILPGPPQDVRSASYTLYVTCAVQPSFTMTANPDTRTISQGQSATYPITVTSVNGFTDNVVIDPPSGLPPGATFAAPPSVAVSPSTPGTFSFALQTVANTPTGTYNIILPGHAQGAPTITDSVQLTLVINGAQDYTFTISPSPLSIPEGLTGSYTVDVRSVNGFSTPIQFTWTMAPTNTGIGFSPASGSLTITPPSVATITVSTSAGTAGTYTLDFTATPQGPGNVKTLPGVQLIITSTMCNGPCPNICVDSSNTPIAPPTTCTNDGDCPPTNRCASQTCRGAAGCQPDKPHGPNDCNKDVCYDSGGTFIIPPTSNDCYQSWPRCKQYDVLKVRKDRQCQEWLTCTSAVTYTDPTSNKDVTQCTKLGRCNQMGPNGECANVIQTPPPKANMTFLSPLQVTGNSSLIRFYSGYSSGFHFTKDTKKVCTKNLQLTCTNDADCRPQGINIDFGPCSADQRIIESNYPGDQIVETGLDGATGNDLVTNGDFEQLTCLGGPRDGLSCILPSDCRVGQGVCADQPEGNGVTVTHVLNTGCTTNDDCSDAQTTTGVPVHFCRYLRSIDQDVTCRNPLDAEWRGITPPGNANEAGFGFMDTSADYPKDVVQGIKKVTVNTIAVQFSVREDVSNFQDLSSKIPGGDPRHPPTALEEHLKDGNNFLSAAIRASAPQFSGVGVSLPSSFSPAAGKYYTLSFKIRASDAKSTTASIKTQLAFNYEKAAGNKICAKRPLYNGGSCTTDIECGMYGPCVANDTRANYENDNFVSVDFGTVDLTEGWKSYAFGPITAPNGVDTNKTTFLNFVSSTTSQSQVTFDIDDVSLKPVLEVANITQTETQKLERRCRMYPRDNSPECKYLEQNGTRYRGWSGYCLDKDPANTDLCLTWWPLDLLAGESPFTTASNIGYKGRMPLDYCVQAEGGPLYDERTDNSGGGIKPQSNFTIPGMLWRDVERIQVFVDFNDSNFDHDGNWLPQVTGATFGHVADNSEYRVTLMQNIDVNNQRWGLGGFANDAQGLQHMLADSCNTGDYWVRVLARINGTDPNLDSSSFQGVYVSMCAYRFVISNPKVKVSVQTRQSCNVIMRVVQPNTKENKAWVGRTDPSSSYTVSNLDYGYMSTTAPFGAIQGDSSQWGSTHRHDLLSGWLVYEPPTTSAIQAGTPYSCRRDCGTSTGNNIKYCFAERSADPCNDANCPTGVTNHCRTTTEMNQCKNEHGSGAVCVGLPLGRCSGNYQQLCGSTSDCGSNGPCLTGTALSDAGNTGLVSSAYGISHLKHLFAKSYGCWQLHAEANAQNVLEYSYIPCTASLNWDIATANGGTMLYCPQNGTVRPADNLASLTPEDYCALRPVVDANHDQFLIQNQKNGNITVAPGTSVIGVFPYAVTEEQEPLEHARIVWWRGSGTPPDPEGECRNAPDNSYTVKSTVETGKYSITTSEIPAGTYKPIACVKDNWGAIGYEVFPGTLTVQ
ncbi:MAG: hypothetical protein V1778_05055 [bacterium]